MSTLEMCERPEEGKWFVVNPQIIDQQLFKEKRIDREQEKTRQIILKAFDEAKELPSYYGEPFATMIPKKTWKFPTYTKLRETGRQRGFLYFTPGGGYVADFLSKFGGGYVAYWVQQALEWAQRIQNGETWEELCNIPDTANWCRLVETKTLYTVVGGSTMLHRISAPARVAGSPYGFNPDYDRTFINSVPLLVRSLRDVYRKRYSIINGRITCNDIH